MANNAVVPFSVRRLRSTSMILVPAMDYFVCLVMLFIPHFCLERSGSVSGTLPRVKCQISLGIIRFRILIRTSLLILGSCLVMIIHPRLIRL